MTAEIVLKSSHQELNETHIRDFVRDYCGLISQPVVFLKPQGAIACPSVDVAVRQRGGALYNYLHTPNPPEDCWGRTIFSEIVTNQVLKAVLGRTLTSRNLDLVLAPTSIDSTVSEGDFYQKGADLYLARREITDCGVLYRPVCGIDVTIANGSTVGDKRRKAGLQLVTVMPVLVLPIRYFPFGVKQFDLVKYLDCFAREAVANGVKDNPFYGLSPQEIDWLKRELGMKILLALDRCRQGIKDSSDSRIKSFQYLPYIYTQLDYMEKMMLEYIANFNLWS